MKLATNGICDSDEEDGDGVRPSIIIESGLSLMLITIWSEEEDWIPLAAGDYIGFNCWESNGIQFQDLIFAEELPWI